MNPIDSSEFIRYSETEKYSFYVKVHILGKEIFINEKLSMKKVIELKNTLDKTPTDPKELEQTFFMRQIDLFVYANFIANRILKLTLKRGQGVDVSQSMNQQNFFASMFERNIKVNSSVVIMQLLICLGYTHKSGSKLQNAQSNFDLQANLFIGGSAGDLDPLFRVNQGKNCLTLGIHSADIQLFEVDNL